MAWLSHQKRVGQDDFSEREQPADVLRGSESVFRDANPANVAKSLLEGNRDQLLTQSENGTDEAGTQSRISQQLLNSELQQQAFAQRLD